MTRTRIERRKAIALVVACVSVVLLAVCVIWVGVSIQRATFDARYGDEVRRIIREVVREESIKRDYRE